MDLALESLDYADLCLINAPFTREVRDVEYMRALRRRLQKKDARLVVVWVKTDPEVVHQRMIQRNSDRDIWKLQHWDAYNAGVNYEIPECLNDPTVTDEFYVVSNNSDEEPGPPCACWKPCCGAEHCPARSGMDERILALDVGDARIGIAVSDPTRTLAQPVEVLQRKGWGRIPGVSRSFALPTIRTWCSAVCP